MPVLLPSDILEEIQSDARNCAPEEMCGMLFGKDDAILAYQQTRNVAENPCRNFEIDPKSLLAAEKAMRNGGPTVVGYVHSHPDGPVLPSRQDREMAAPDGRMWLIVNGKDHSLWRAVRNSPPSERFTRLSLDHGPLKRDSDG